MKIKTINLEPSNNRVLGGFQVVFYLLMLFGLVEQTAANTSTATPVVNTTISVSKTGSEPFDNDTWDGGDLTKAGLDADEDNDVVRLQDTITYQVEVSVNDNDVQSLTSSVLLDKRQAWLTIPDGCKTDPDEVNPVSSISADKLTLFCNLGPAIEGTTRIFYPTARVLGASRDGTLITLNDQHVSANVTAQADGVSNTATAGPTGVTVTAGFKVDTVKELAVTATDPDSGESLYRAPDRKSQDGTQDGSVMEYVIKVRYQQGSMMVDAPDEAGGDFEIDFKLLDHYTDDNPNNDSVVSTGAVLYDWDSSKPACELVGDHGPNATVSCSQVNHVLDLLGPTVGTPDGVNDPNIEIDLQNIDVRDPNADGNLVELKLNIWYSEPDDIATQQNCASPCEIFTVNSVGVYDATGGAGGTPTVIGFNPVSTEDASNNNLLNYNGAGEPHPGYVTYPLVYTTPGTWTIRKSFYGANPQASATGKPTLTRSYARGQIIPFMLDVWDYRNRHGAQSHICDKIDTNNFEFVGVAAPNRTDMGYAWNEAPYNPNLIFFYNGAKPTTYHGEAAKEYIETFYSDEPNTTLQEMRDDACNDDVNNDGFFIVDGMDQNTGLASAEPNDWVTDPETLVGGAASVSKIRMQTTIDKTYMNSVDPSAEKLGFTLNYLMRIKPDAVGYPNPDGNTYLLNLSTSRRHDGDGNWIVGGDKTPEGWFKTDDTGTYSVSIDPNDASFGYEFLHADRVILVPSSITLDKYTEPRGIKVVKAGDTVDFILEPQVIGSWSSDKNTASLADSLPGATDYIQGSESFSVDGGVSWLSYDEYQASSPVVTLSSVANTSKSSLLWEFGDIQTGEQLPLVRYTVQLEPDRVSGTFINTATLDSPIGIDEVGGGDPDGDGPLRESPDGVADTKEVEYQLSMFSQNGLDVFKSRAKPVYSTNEAMLFTLQYKNLGAENYTTGDFIDILPYNNDGDGRVSSGLDSTRQPGSNFHGTYAVTAVNTSNGEVVFATDADPADIDQDPCHESNQPAGEVPEAGDVCYNMYVQNGNQFAGGSASGSGTTNWVECSDPTAMTCGSLDKETITAIRFTVSGISAADVAELSVELTPQGNVGGTPALDSLKNVLASSTGDIYTNNFGGRVPELSLLVISNDVSVTVVGGSIGDRVWLDANADRVQDVGEAGIANVTIALFDKDDNPVYVLPDTGGIVAAGTENAVPYQVVTDGSGNYVFENLPRNGAYYIRVLTDTLPGGLIQTHDFSGALNHHSGKSLTWVQDEFGQLIGIEDNRDQDFGYRLAVVDLKLEKTVDKTTVKRGETVVYTLTVTNEGVDDATAIEVTDTLPSGVTYVDHTDGETVSDGVWEVGDLPAGESKTLEITVRID